MDIRGFHHLAIQVQSLERMAAFYSGVLGLPELERHLRPDGSVRSIWLSLCSGFLALEEATGEPTGEPFISPRPGLHLLALRIDASDRARVRDALERHGAAIIKETGWTLYIQDPEGNRIGLSHHPTPG